MQSIRKPAVIAVCCMLLTLFGILSIVSPAQASTVTTVNTIVDNVPVVIQMPILAQVSSFSVGGLPNAVYASSTHPFISVKIEALPYGVSDDSEGIYSVQQNTSGKVSTQLKQNRMHSGGSTLQSLTALLFGHIVTGTIEKDSLQLVATHKQNAYVAEWVTEAGNRMWVVRIVQESTSITPAQFVSSLKGARLSSDNLNAATGAQSQPVASKAAAIHPLTSVNNTTTYPLPPNWGGKNCDTNHYAGALPLSLSQDGYAQQIGFTTPTFNGVSACGPMPTSGPSPYLGGYQNTAYLSSSDTHGVDEWECVELSMRYLFASDGTLPYSGDGWQVVSNYPYHVRTVINNNSSGKAPQPGDVMSIGNSDPGHTDVVIATSYSGNGNGSGDIYTLDENAYWWTGSSDNVANRFPYPVNLYTISNWSVNGSVTGWLHDPNSGGGGNNGQYASHSAVTQFNGSTLAYFNLTGGNVQARTHTTSSGWTSWQAIPGVQGTLTGTPSVMLNQSGLPEVFIHATNGTAWHSWLNTDGTWASWTALGSGSTIGSDIAPTTHTDSAGTFEEAFALDTSGNAIHSWANVSNGLWQPWVAVPAGAMTFTGNPSTVINALGNPEVFAYTPNGSAWHTWLNADGSWGNWSRIGTNALVNSDISPTIRTTSGITYEEIFALDGSGNVIHSYVASNTPNGTWADWSLVTTAQAFVGKPDAIINTVGTPEIFVHDGNNAAWHTWLNPNGGSWDTWHQIGATGAVGTDLVALLHDNNTIEEAFALDPSNNPTHAFASVSGGVWGNWNTQF